MQVLIIGGTGFIGYHACRELLARGHEVTVMGLPPGPARGLFPGAVKKRLVDLAKLSDRQLQQRLKGYDAVVFAAGADDRVTPDGPAYRFFYEANVRSTVRVTAAALRAGVGKLVLLGSYFTYFNREWPELQLAEHHPYIMSRREQMELGAVVAGSDMAFIALELPYIFGAMPGQVPLWQPIVNYVRSGVDLFYTNGGTNMIAVEHVAEAIAGACERIERSRVYQIGDRNVSWTEFLQGLCAAMGREDDRVRIISDDAVNNVGWIGDALYRFHGKEGGLHPSHFTQVHTACTYFDPAASRRALGYGSGGLERAWQETVDACPPSERVEMVGHYLKWGRKLLRAGAVS